MWWRLDNMLLQLFAEGGGVDPSAVLPAVSTVGSLGFAVWYAWYTTTSVIPKLLDAHRQERQEMEVRHDGQITKLLEDFKEQRVQWGGNNHGRPPKQV